MKNWKRCLIVPAVWLALTAAMWFAPKQEMSISERRKLQQMPAFTAQTILDGRFMTQFETYSQDQFPLRDGFRRLKAVVSYGVVRRLDNNGIYLAQGSAAKLEYPLNEASVRKAAAKFQSIYDRYLKDSSGKIVFSVVPDKSFYLADANGYPSMDYEAMFSAFREIPWADYVDLTPALSADSYYRTDTHWRQECLLDAAALLAQSLDVDIRADFTPVKLERPFYGVYDGQAALPMKPDELWVLESDSLYACTTYNIENRKTAQVYDMEKLSSRDLNDVFLSGPVSVLTVENPAANTDKELIVFRDSFGSSLVPLLVPGYAKVTLVDIRYLPADKLGEFVEFGNQDVLFLYSTLVLNQSSMLK